MKIQNYDRQLETLQSYGLSFAASISILERVEAFTGEVPQAVADETQVIADMFNVGFTFHQKTYPKNPTKMTISGIFNQARASFLYHDDKKVSKFCKNAKECRILPGSDNVLEFI